MVGSARKDKNPFSKANAVMVVIALALVGFAASDFTVSNKTSKTPEHNVITQVPPGELQDTEAFEECYKGVTYVVFMRAGGRGSPTIMLDRNSKIVPCQ